MPATIAPCIIPVAGQSFVRPSVLGEGIRLYGASSGYVGFKPASAAGSTDYTLPSSPPSVDGQVLVGTTAGVLSWTTISTGLTVDSTPITGGGSGRILFESATGKVSESSKLVWDGTKAAITGPGSAGTAIFRFNPASGNAHVQVNDNGTVVIDADVSTGTTPLNVKYNGTVIASLSYGGMWLATKFQTMAAASDTPSIAGFVGVGGGWALHSSVTGNEARLNVYGTGTPLAAISVAQTTNVGINKTAPTAQLHVVAGSAATVGSIVQGAASQSVDISQWNPYGVTAGTRARITSGGDITNDRGVITNACFGAGAMAAITSGYQSTAVGYDALATASSNFANTAVGCLTLSQVISGHFNTAVGSQAATWTDTIGRTAIGCLAGKAASGSYSTFLGASCCQNWITLNYCTMLGALITPQTDYATYTGSVAIGAYTVMTGSNQFVSGASSYPIDNLYFGKGVTNATPTAYTINGTGGSGTNIAGGDIVIAGGKGTGNAAGGSILFKTSDAGASGSTLQSLTTKMTILPDGSVLIGTATAVEPFTVGLVTSFSKQAYCPQQTLTDAASISWDLDTQPSAVVTLADNRTLAAPTNQKAGATYILIVKQDATGSRTLTFNAVYKFAGGTVPEFTATANAVDILTFVSDGTYMYGVAQNDLR